MKTETIVNIFHGSQNYEAIVRKVMNSISGPENFKRRLDLKPAFKELKEIYETYIEMQQELAKKYIKQYCDDINEENKNSEGWKDLDPEQIQRVPMNLMPAYNKELKEIVDVEVTIKKPLKFYQDEIENAKLIWDEEELIDEFVMWGKNKPKPKAAKK